MDTVVLARAPEPRPIRIESSLAIDAVGLEHVDQSHGGRVDLAQERAFGCVQVPGGEPRALIFVHACA